MVKDANRPLTPKHASDIEKYLEEREDWLLGTLQLGIAQELVEFQPYPELMIRWESSVSPLLVLQA